VQEATSPDAREQITELSSVTPGQQNASLESVQNYLDEATHSDMDKMILDVLLDEVLILNVVAKYSEGELDPQCANRNHVAILIREQPELREVLAKAFETKSFRDIRNLSATFALSPNASFPHNFLYLQRSCVPAILFRSKGAPRHVNNPITLILTAFSCFPRSSCTQ
jgi:hypothetical protein